MKNILPAIATVLAIGISSWYFTSQPIADASNPPIQDGAIGAILVNIVKRLDTVEKKLKLKVPEDQQIGITSKQP